MSAVVAVTIVKTYIGFEIKKTKKTINEKSIKVHMLK